MNSLKKEEGKKEFIFLHAGKLCMYKNEKQPDIDTQT